MYDKLIADLKEDAEWAEANEWEIPIMLPTHLKQAANAIEELSKPKWIPVTEQLPESGQRVLVVGLHGEAMYIGTYTGGIKETAYRKAKPYKINAGGYGWRSFTWWMPLPQPPKEE